MGKPVPAGGCFRIRYLRRTLPLLFLLAGRQLSAQPANQTGISTFSANVDLVVLHPAVSDKKGGFVPGLEKENFHVWDNGVPQHISLFQHEDVPVAVGLIVDNSGSMRPKRKDVTAAAMAFVQSSNPHDQMFVVDFNERVSFGLPNTELFSADSAELAKALNGIPAAGETALYDAIIAGLDHLKKATLDKKVLMVISDGGDNASHHTLAQVLDQAARSDVLIYTIGLFNEYDEDRNPAVLKKIARATGGEAFLPTETAQVIGICKRIAQDIRNQYTIGYLPSDSKFAWHTIHVTAAGPHGGKYRVRTRAGYIASPEKAP